VLKAYLDLIEQEVKAGKAIKDAQAALDEKVSAKYKMLSVDEVKRLVVDDKWMATLYAVVKSEMERVSQALTQRIKELSERYTAPLPRLDADVETLTAKVEAHLHKMGHEWN
jgi:type I restriction enzyme M protein